MTMHIRTLSSPRVTSGLLLLMGVAAPACAQTPFVRQALGEAQHWTWSENAGFVTFRRTAGYCNNVTLLLERYMQGSAWGENIGWINFGNGPITNSEYTNNQVTFTPTGPRVDYGVNIVRNSFRPDLLQLSGWAWGENIGWINFDGNDRPGSPPLVTLARYDPAAKRIRGFAWGENIGWINFDSMDVRVEYFCRTDMDQNGIVDTVDIFDFLNAWFNQETRADFDCNGVDVQAIFQFLQSWFAGC